MRVVRASLLTASVSALLKPVRKMSIRGGGATRSLQRPVCSVLVFVPELSHQWNSVAYDWSMAWGLTAATGSE